MGRVPILGQGLELDQYADGAVLPFDVRDEGPPRARVIEIESGRVAAELAQRLERRGVSSAGVHRPAGLHQARCDRPAETAVGPIDQDDARGSGQALGLGGRTRCGRRAGPGPVTGSVFTR